MQKNQVLHILPAQTNSNALKVSASFLHIFRKTIVLLALIAVLFGIDAVCYAIALPVDIDVQNGVGTLYVGSQVVALGKIGTPAELEFVLHDSAVHEYQIDGTDSTNNFTLNPQYITSLSSSPYYRFWAWMRDLDGTSRWRNLQVQADGQMRSGIMWPTNGTMVPLPAAGSLHVSVQLQRPETPMTLDLITADEKILHITLDRNNRQISVTEDVPGKGSNLPIASTFFPLDAASVSG